MVSERLRKLATVMQCFVLVHRVAQPPAAVYPVFAEASFVESLAPRSAGLEVLQIGLGLDAEIRVRFRGLGPRGRDWVSRIEELDESAAGIWFVDRAVQIPWPFASFRHRHGFVAEDGGTLLVDDIAFAARPAALGPLLMPLLRRQFGYRGRIYRERFGAR
jgi:ligand-binding SRPBCC domain-containing protein